MLLFFFWTRCRPRPICFCNYGFTFLYRLPALVIVDVSDPYHASVETSFYQAFFFKFELRHLLLIIDMRYRFLCDGVIIYRSGGRSGNVTVSDGNI